MSQKTCNKCNIPKDLNDFDKDSRNKDGRRGTCKDCRHAIHLTVKEKHNRTIREYNRANPEVRLWDGAKKRANQSGIPFSLNRKDIVIPDRCPYLDIPLMMGSGSHHDNSPTLDRIDSSKGYTKDNIIVCSWRANVIKRDATPDELMKIATKLVEWQSTEN